MTDKVTIANLALNRLDSSRITSFDDPVKAAREISTIYDPVRQSLLHRFNWRFAIARATLVNTGTAPAFGFDNAYLLPTDSLRVIGPFDSSQGNGAYTASDLQWKIEAGETSGASELLANVSTMQIFYIRDIQTAGNFDPSFVNALWLELAIALCFTLTGSRSLLPDLKQELAEAMRTARFTNAIQASMEQVVQSEWDDARRGGRGDLRRNGWVYN